MGNPKKYEVNLVFSIASFVIFALLLYRAIKMKPRQHLLLVFTGLQTSAAFCSIFHDILWLTDVNAVFDYHNFAEFLHLIFVV
jgi:hypothetical protein